MIFYTKPRKFKRCPCGKMLRSHNKSGKCSKCLTNVYKDKTKHSKRTKLEDKTKWKNKTKNLIVMSV